MPKKLTTEKVGTGKQPVTSVQNGGLVSQIVEEFLKRLRESRTVEVDVMKSLQDLASKGKLKDPEAVLVALRTPQQANKNAPS
jgi:hypothetical protein